MNHISDFIWKKIDEELKPDPRLRVALNRLIEFWKGELESYSEYREFRSIEIELQNISESVDSLFKSIKKISNGAYGHLIRDCDQEKILDMLGPDFTLGDHKNIHSYYHREIIGLSLPFLKAIFKNATEQLKFREMSSMKIRNKIRDMAIPEIEEACYVFAGKILQTGKLSSSIWLRPILNIIGCHTTDNSVETAIRKWAKERDSSGNCGINYYRDRNSYFVKRVIYNHDKPVSRFVWRELNKEELF